MVKNGSKQHVNSALGEGLLERVYEKAFIVELEARGVRFACQKEYPVSYRDVPVGLFRADLVIENIILVELKSVAMVTSGMESQYRGFARIKELIRTD